MVLLLFLSACCTVGSSYGESVYHGNTYEIELVRRSRSIEFIPKHSSNVTILWTRDDPSARDERRFRVSNDSFVIKSLSHDNSGKYTTRDKAQLPMSVVDIEVIPKTVTYVRKVGGSLQISFGLERHSCSVFFFPYNNSIEGTGFQVVQYGRVLETLYHSDCTGFIEVSPCGLSNKGLEIECSGRYEVRDGKGRPVFEMLLKIKDSYAYEIAIGVGTSVAVLLCITCVACCCCKKKAPKREEPAEPAVRYLQYNEEPVRRRPTPVDRPSGPYRPAQRSEEDKPPSYDEISEFPDAPNVPIDSDEPRFELKGVTFPSAPPLGSESTYSHVYTSRNLT